MRSIIKKISDITITLDYRTELLGIIMLLGNYHKKFPHLFLKYENQFYVDRILRVFGDYKNDEIIEEFDNLVEKHSFNYDAPFALFLELDEHLKSSQLSEYVFKDRLNNDDDIYLFLDKLEAFAKKIDFENYYRNNIPEYTQYVESISKAFEKYDITSFLRAYYGYSSGKQFFINLIPFTTNGAYCCNYETKIYSCFPVFEGMKKENLFDSRDKEKYIVDNPVHEFSHGYINPITKKYNILNEKTHFFDDIREQMSKKAYPYDTQIINEYIIRAICARYILLMYHDQNWYQRRIESEKESGFIYIEPIIESLLEYENNRQVYPRFDLFYPNIIASLEKYKK